MFSIFKRERKETAVERALREELELVKGERDMTQKTLQFVRKEFEQKLAEAGKEFDQVRRERDAYWRSIGELGDKVKELQEQAKEVEELRRTEQILRAEIILLVRSERLKDVQLDPLVVSMGLAGVTAETAWWKALHSILNQEIMLARDASVQPNLASETRHYNAGRCAGLVDLQATLLGAWAREQQVAPAGQ